MREQLADDKYLHDRQIGTVCEEEPIDNGEFTEANWTGFESSLHGYPSFEATRPVYYDDISGAPLPGELVEKAIGEEMAEYSKHNVYSKVPISQCLERTGKKPIGVRWVIVNKGDEVDYNVRARLVGKEFKTNNTMAMFAATPPLEAKKFLFSKAATSRGSSSPRGEYKLVFIDIKRAYMYAPETREVYVDLPEQDSEPGMCGLLNKSMYGTRGAAQSWETWYSTIFVNELGFKQGVASVCCFYHEERDIRVVVHGDDFTGLCVREQVHWLITSLQAHFELKVSGRLGSDPDDDKAVRILNRTVRWTSEGILYESDVRPAEIVVKQLGLDGSKGCKAVTTPGVKEAIPEVDSVIASQRQTLYRSLVMRIAYLAQDRGDLSLRQRNWRVGCLNPQSTIGIS